jgi:hypothetical protein
MSQLIATLNQIAKGQAIAEADAALAALVEQVKTIGKAGKLTLTLAIGPTKINGALQLEMESKATAPRPDRQASLFFIGRDGMLTREDPNQKEFPFALDAAPKAATAYPEPAEKFGT